MGGTSTDVSLLESNLPIDVESNIAGYPVKTLVIDIHTVGAGGGSIAYLAHLLHIHRIMIPENSGILSAIGMLMADIIKDYSETVMKHDITANEPAALFKPLEQKAISELYDKGVSKHNISLNRFADIRYIGQSYEIIVPFSENFAEGFHKLHKSRYGYSNTDKAVEVVNIRVRAIGKTKKPKIKKCGLVPDKSAFLGQSATDIKIKLTMRIADDVAELDFSDSDDQTKGNINAVYAITMSAVLYVFRSLVLQDIPTNSGCMRPIKVIARKGSIVDAEFPSAVAAGNVETSQRIVDVVLGALSLSMPGVIPAASQGTTNNITIRGIDESGKPFTYYETIGGGMGANNKSSGESAIHSHMTNTLNTPIEALEYSYPFMVTEYSIRKGSGGKGKFCGGNGLNREIKLLSDAQITVLSERRKSAPYGLKGGDAEQRGKNIIKFSGQEQKEMPSKFNINLKKGDIIRIETPGGGGYGK